MPNMRQKYVRNNRAMAVASTPVNRTARQARCRPTNGTHLSQLGTPAFLRGWCHKAPAGRLTLEEMAELMTRSFAAWLTLKVLLDYRPCPVIFLTGSCR